MTVFLNLLLLWGLVKCIRFSLFLLLRQRLLLRAINLATFMLIVHHYLLDQSLLALLLLMLLPVVRHFSVFTASVLIGSAVVLTFQETK